MIFFIFFSIIPVELWRTGLWRIRFLSNTILLLPLQFLFHFLWTPEAWTKWILKCQNLYFELQTSWRHLNGWDPFIPGRICKYFIKYCAVITPLLSTTVASIFKKTMFYFIDQSPVNLRHTFCNSFMFLHTIWKLVLTTITFFVASLCKNCKKYC